MIVALAAAPAVAAPPTLDWTACAEGVECATATVPRDHGDPGGPTLDLAVARVPARDPTQRIGSVFLNFGGPGAPGAQILRSVGPEGFAALGDRFDVVSWDPRGTGTSAGAVDCEVDQETEGAYSQPFPRPSDPASEAAFVERTRAYVHRCLERNDAGLLPYLGTTQTVRDLDLLRQAVGDEKLTYVGYSAGTVIGAQYATLFPGLARANVLDGAVDPARYVRRPVLALREQTAAFERALGRFLAACAARQDVCRFGGEDPPRAFDELAARLDADPLPVTGAGGRMVDGDDARAAALAALYAKPAWPVLASALAGAAAGDPAEMRALADAFYGREEDGGSAPGLDAFVAIGALDQRWPADAGPYLRSGAHAFRLFDHFWVNDYGALSFGLWPAEPVGAYSGPVENPSDAATTLVVGTTYDPATPYKDARAMTADLGNARLLTMRGDGHTASFNGNSSCVDGAVEAYLERGVVPAPGAACDQDVPFAAPERTGRQAHAPPRPVRPPW